MSGTSSTGAPDTRRFTIFVPAGANLRIDGSLDVLGERGETIFSIDPLLYTLQGDPRGGGPFLNIPFSRTTRDPASVSGDVTLSVYQHERIYTDVAWRFTATLLCNGSPCQAEPEIRVMTWNVKTADFAPEEWAKVINDLKPDILTLQEVCARESTQLVNTLKEQYGLAYTAAAGPVRDGPYTGCGRVEVAIQLVGARVVAMDRW